MLPVNNLAPAGSLLPILATGELTAAAQSTFSDLLLSWGVSMEEFPQLFSSDSQAENQNPDEESEQDLSLLMCMQGVPLMPGLVSKNPQEQTGETVMECVAATSQEHSCVLSRAPDAMAAGEGKIFLSSEQTVSEQAFADTIYQEMQPDNPPPFSEESGAEPVKNSSFHPFTFFPDNREDGIRRGDPDIFPIQDTEKAAFQVLTHKPVYEIRPANTQDFMEYSLHEANTAGQEGPALGKKPVDAKGPVFDAVLLAVDEVVADPENAGIKPVSGYRPIQAETLEELGKIPPSGEEKKEGNSVSFAQDGVQKTGGAVRPDSAENIAAAPETGKAEPFPIQSGIAEELALAARSGKKELRVTLTPENLGEITLQLVSDADGVQARIITESQQIKRELDYQSPILKEVLKEQGCNLSSLEVCCKTDMDARSFFSGREERQRQQQYGRQNQRAKTYGRGDAQVESFVSLSAAPPQQTGFDYLA